MWKDYEIWPAEQRFKPCVPLYKPTGTFKVNSGTGAVYPGLSRIFRDSWQVCMLHACDRLRSERLAPAVSADNISLQYILFDSEACRDTAYIEIDNKRKLKKVLEHAKDMKVGDERA